MNMEDIAKIAKVSKAAVSLALNGKPGISAGTRERILTIVRDQGYLPKSMIKADQVYGVGKTLRFIVFTKAGIVLEQYYKQPFFMELIHFLEERARSHGYSLMFSAINVQDDQQGVQQFLSEGNSKGMILLGTNLDQEMIRQIAGMETNLVVLDTCFETLAVNFVVMNNVKGAYDAGRYLCEHGHERIGYVQSDIRMYNFDMRRQGFMTALLEHRLNVNDSDLFTVTPTLLSVQEDFKQQIQARLNRNESLPTAMFCECDYIAISVIKSLAEMGIRVPEDISIIGFDNISEAEVISPELTTIHVEKKVMAAHAVDKLIQMIEHDDNVKMKTIVDTMIIERASCREISPITITKPGTSVARVPRKA